jgi:hypothetical protein
MTMATGAEVLAMLIPTGGWVINGDDFDSIRYDDGVKPITKKQFEAGFEQVENWKVNQETDKAQAKATAQAKLAALGLTLEDLTALGL